MKYFSFRVLTVNFFFFVLSAAEKPLRLCLVVLWTIMFVMSPPSRGRILFGLGVAYLLVQYMFINYYNESRRFDVTVAPNTQIFFPSTNNNHSALKGYLNISGIENMVSEQRNESCVLKKKFLLKMYKFPPLPPSYRRLRLNENPARGKRSARMIISESCDFVKINR